MRRHPSCHPASIDSQNKRHGSIIVLSAVLMVVVFAFTAFTVDTGYIVLTKVRLQNTADAAALSAVQQLDSDENVAVVYTNSRADAIAIAMMNMPNQGSVLVDADIEFGEWDAAAKQFLPVTDWPNAIRVTTRRSTLNNNPLMLFFAPVIGHHFADVQASSIATLVPASGSGGGSSGGANHNVDAFPLALRDPDFGVVDQDIDEDNPGKDGPSKPADGVKFRQGEQVTLFIYGKGKQSPVHLGLNIENITDVNIQDILAGKDNQTSVELAVDDLLYVINEGTGSGGLGSAADDRLDYSWSHPLREVIVPIVAELPGSRDSDGELSGLIKIVGFVKVHLDAVIDVQIIDPDNTDNTIDIELLVGTVVEDQPDDPNYYAKTRDGRLAK